MSTPHSTNKSTAKIRTFTVPTSSSSKGATLDIRITEPALRADNLTLETWASSYILASVLHTLDLSSCFPSPSSAAASSSSPSGLSPAQPAAATSPRHPDDPDDADPPPLPILELGAGTGLVGLTAACLLRTAAVLTDLPGIVAGVAANVAANRELLQLSLRSTTAVVAGSLDWRHPDAIVLHGSSGSSNGSIDTEASAATTIIPSARKARLVLAADTVYDEAHPELLAGVVGRWLVRDAAARFVICYPLRVAYLDIIRELWDRLERMGMVADREGRRTGEATNGDDEMLCEWVAWRWKLDAEGG